MKQTIQEVKAALDAFERNGEVERSPDGIIWDVSRDSDWNLGLFMYRPVKKPQAIKYLCYEDGSGFLVWKNGGVNPVSYTSYKRVPDLDKEVTR